MIQDTKRFKRLFMLQVVASSISACNKESLSDLYEKIMQDFKRGLDKLKVTKEENTIVFELLSKSDTEIRNKYKQLNKKRK